MAEHEEDMARQAIERDIAEIRERMEKDPEFRQVIRNMMEIIERGDFVPRGRWVEVPPADPEG